MQSGELFDYIVEKGRLLEDEARRYFQQIIRYASNETSQTWNLFHKATACVQYFIQLFELMRALPHPQGPRPSVHTPVTENLNLCNKLIF